MRKVTARLAKRKTYFFPWMCIWYLLNQQEPAPYREHFFFLDSPEKLRTGRRMRPPEKAAQPVISTPEGGCSFYLVFMCISWTTPLPSRARISQSFSCHDVKIPNFKAIEVSTQMFFKYFQESNCFFRCLYKVSEKILKVYMLELLRY